MKTACVCFREINVDIRVDEGVACLHQRVWVDLHK